MHTPLPRGTGLARAIGLVVLLTLGSGSCLSLLRSTSGVLALLGTGLLGPLLRCLLLGTLPLLGSGLLRPRCK